MTTTTVKVNVYDDQGSLVEVADVQDVDQWASERDLDTLQGGSGLVLAYPDTLEGYQRLSVLLALYRLSIGCTREDLP